MGRKKCGDLGCVGVCMSLLLLFLCLLEVFLIFVEEVGWETVGHLLCDRKELISSVCFLRSPQESSIEYLIIRSVRNCLSVVVLVFCALEVGRGVWCRGC